MSSFFSSFFDAAITIPATNVTPAAPVEAPAKDSSKEEAADRTAGGNGLFHERRAEEVG